MLEELEGRMQRSTCIAIACNQCTLTNNLPVETLCVNMCVCVSALWELSRFPNWDALLYITLLREAAIQARKIPRPFLKYILKGK